MTFEEANKLCDRITDKISRKILDYLHNWYRLNGSRKIKAIDIFNMNSDIKTLIRHSLQYDFDLQWDRPLSEDKQKIVVNETPYLKGTDEPKMVYFDSDTEKIFPKKSPLDNFLIVLVDDDEEDDKPGN